MSRFFVGMLMFGMVQGFACTDFLLTDTNKGCVVGRSMEFGTDLESDVVISAKGDTYQSIVQGKDGLIWEQIYDFIGLSAFGNDQFIVDGMNEVGLSFGVLWLPDAKYPQSSLKDLSCTIALQDVGSWILGTAATVEEAKAAFTSKVIYPEVLPQLSMIPPVHFAIHDPSGKSLVVEFTDNRIQIIDNPISVLTNNPKFDWHMNNLRNYLNLSANNADTKTLNGIPIIPMGQGSGMIGLPGDSSPPSRFVKMALLTQCITPANSSKENVNLAFHLLNSVDIAKGSIQTANEDSDYTQWSVVKDLQNITLYFRTYDDLNMKSLSLIEFIPNGSQKLDMSDSRVISTRLRTTPLIRPVSIKEKTPRLLKPTVTTHIAL